MLVDRALKGALSSTATVARSPCLICCFWGQLNGRGGCLLASRRSIRRSSMTGQRSMTTRMLAARALVAAISSITLSCIQTLLAPRRIAPSSADLLRTTKRIALVGASTDPDRPSHRVMRFLLECGYDVTPINPNHLGETIHGRAVVATLDEAAPLDMVDVWVFAAANLSPPLSARCAAATSTMIPRMPFSPT